MSTSILTKETVIVQFIPNFKNNVLDKQNPLYGGLSNKATIGIPAPLHNNGINKIFTKDEIAELEKELDMSLGPKSIFWREFAKDENGMKVGIFPIYIDKSGLFLDKSDPTDFIKIRVLENSPIVAISEADARSRASEVRFKLINKKDIHKEELNKIDNKRKAFGLYGKVSENKDVLLYIMRSFNKSVDSSLTLEFLQTEVWKLMEWDVNFFTEVVGDPRIITKIKMYDFVNFGLITKKDGFYYDSEGKKLALDGKQNDINGAAEFLDSGVGSEMRLVLEAKIESLKK